MSLLKGLETKPESPVKEACDLNYRAISSAPFFQFIAGKGLRYLGAIVIFFQLKRSCGRLGGTDL